MVDDYQAIAADKDTTAGAAVTSEFEAEKQNMTLKFLFFFTATGATFTLGFQTITAASAITGFDLVYQQVPCA